MSRSEMLDSQVIIFLVVYNMRFSTIFGSVLLAAPIQAAKLLICSDSTTANYATGNALQGLVTPFKHRNTFPYSFIMIDGAFISKTTPP